MNEKKYERAGAIFQKIGLGQYIDSIRQNQLNKFEPWLGRNKSTPSESDDFFKINHLNRKISRKNTNLTDTNIAELINCNFVESIGDSLCQGAWRATHSNGIYCVSDVNVEGHSNVYAGDDSLLFSNFLLTLPRAKTALDIGSGTGISTVAIAKNCDYVIGLDVVPECVDAGNITAALNGCADKTLFLSENLETFFTKNRYEIVAANPPGVPVPRTINYSVAGNGGSDGLDLVRTVLHSCERWCTKDGIVCMRFQSIRNDHETKIYREIKDIATLLKWDVTLIADIQVPIEIRSALTARNAKILNPHLSNPELIRALDIHMNALDAKSYTSTLMFAKTNGTGQISIQAIHGAISLDTVLTNVLLSTNGIQKNEIYFELLSILGTLPGIFWKLGGHLEILTIINDLEKICFCIRESITPRVLFNELYPNVLRSADAEKRSIILPFLLVIEAMHNLNYLNIGH